MCVPVSGYYDNVAIYSHNARNGDDAGSLVERRGFPPGYGTKKMHNRETLG